MKDNRWQLAEKWSNGICTWSATKFRIKLLQSSVKGTCTWWWRWTVTVVLRPTRLRWGGGDGEWFSGRKRLFRRLTKQSRTKYVREISLNVVIMKGLGLNKNLHYRSVWASALWRQMRFGLQDQKSCMDTKVVARHLCLHHIYSCPASDLALGLVAPDFAPSSPCLPSPFKTALQPSPLA